MNETNIIICNTSKNKTSVLLLTKNGMAWMSQASVVKRSEK